ncbi:hypothetical protein CEXT_455351 [Caerostris extrusa]|uniref:Uncharacterized protein n=1 Tax=Caerostris extrusa TaxID=172846 RepID=A0AAV4W4A7_CAEEX|nr:hypothetical protein CEXT_455351 [Caerostris extrusa]
MSSRRLVGEINSPSNRRTAGMLWWRKRISEKSRYRINSKNAFAFMKGFRGRLTLNTKQSRPFSIGESKDIVMDVDNDQIGSGEWSMHDVRSQLEWMRQSLLPALRKYWLFNCVGFRNDRLHIITDMFNIRLTYNC